MPRHKSPKKRMRSSETARQRNRSAMTALRNALKEVRTAKSKKDATEKLREASAMLDKAAGKKLIHKKNADRNKSRLAKLIDKLS